MTTAFPILFVKVDQFLAALLSFFPDTINPPFVIFIGSLFLSFFRTNLMYHLLPSQEVASDHKIFVLEETFRDIQFNFPCDGKIMF